jgi:hypothetical protein
MLDELLQVLWRWNLQQLAPANGRMVTQSRHPIYRNKFKHSEGHANAVKYWDPLEQL